ncbi:hypothetical protein [[Mycoplasma] gypis]|uniref:Uncharacterized protein n=1 Tax=[Mycoplasma] gypis TaxID=92404 RepID=A0ABZ2RUT4_9BACT|nr:hypothetical protein [[Mycoplasma] gypis]MBN0919332.1 hypothetical protein [[Mycoplasma] gypis]
MKKDFNSWLDFFAKNKKALFEIKKHRTDTIDSEFFQDIKLNEGTFVAEVGYGFNKFNEATVRGIAQAYVFYLKTLHKNLHEVKVLIATDGSSKEFNNFMIQFGEVLMASNIKVYLFERNVNVTNDFCFFALQKVEEIDNLIYFSNFSRSHEQKALYIYENKVKRLPSQKIDTIYNLYLNDVNIFFTRTLSDDFNYLKIDMLVYEYVDEILKLQVRSFDNKKLKVSVVSNPSTNYFVQKILGKMDYSYRFIKKNNHSVNKKLFFKKFAFIHSHDKTQNYIFEFTEEGKNLVVYEKTFGSFYKRIDNNDLFMAYLEFIGKEMKMNQKNLRYENIFLSLFSRNNLFKLDEKYFKNMTKRIFLSDRDYRIEKSYFMNIDEDGRLFVKKPYMIQNNGLMSFVIILEMLNYFNTQKKTFSQVKRDLDKLYGNEKLDIYHYPISRQHLKEFLEIIQNLKQISGRFVNNNEPMTTYRSFESQYVYKIYFDNNEWLGIKFDKINDEIVVYNLVKKQKHDVKNVRKFIKNLIKNLDKQTKSSKAMILKSKFLANQDHQNSSEDLNLEEE